MPLITKTCRQNSSHTFVITDEDQAFYEKMKVPPPTLCPDCRQQRRLSYRNERKLYHRKCNLCGKELIAIYSSDKPFRVYCHECWWGSTWDALEYGSTFDFQKTFFEQWRDLFLQIPRISTYSKGNENSEYTNHCDHAKNAYLCVDTGFSEDIYYSKWIIKCVGCVDSYNLYQCELCYECQHSTQCYHSTHLTYCQSCYDSHFLYDCKGCRNCFLCAGLRNKEFHIQNKPYSKEEYFKKITPHLLGDNGAMSETAKVFQSAVLPKIPRCYCHIVQAEHCTGDDIQTSKNLRQCYQVYKSQDSSYSYDSSDLISCYDTYEAAFDCELQYDTHACNRCKRTMFTSISYDNFQISYCDMSHNCQNCFGCIGMKRAQYCILNKQYTKEEYEKLVPKIIEHMKKTGEWGEFFPMSLSPFGYNETVAQEYFPLTKEEALQLGAKWKEEDITNKYEGPKVIIPDHIKDVGDDITKQILTCETCHKNYRLIVQELKFYRNMRLPVPRNCPDCRHRARLALRNPRKLWDRKCMKCNVDIQTTYSPERTEIVYCEECYNKEIY